MPEQPGTAKFWQLGSRASSNNFLIFLFTITVKLRIAKIKYRCTIIRYMQLIMIVN